MWMCVWKLTKLISSKINGKWTRGYWLFILLKIGYGPFVHWHPSLANCYFLGKLLLFGPQIIMSVDALVNHCMPRCQGKISLTRMCRLGLVNNSTTTKALANWTQIETTKLTVWSISLRLRCFITSIWGYLGIYLLNLFLPTIRF